MFAKDMYRISQDSLKEIGKGYGSCKYMNYQMSGVSFNNQGKSQLLNGVELKNKRSER
ncbi:hypothetical protein U1Q18_052582 [Sarracenia purpurea var. burkii]